MGTLRVCTVWSLDGLMYASPPTSTVNPKEHRELGPRHGVGGSSDVDKQAVLCPSPAALDALQQRK
jgi:hypothetical protein